jgi:hypothetical protein
MAGVDDFGETESAHDLADLHRWHVLRDISHPDAHGGIDGEVFDAGEGLTVVESGNGRFGKFENVRGYEAMRTCGEFPLTIDAGHKEENRRGGEEVQELREDATKAAAEAAELRRVPRKVELVPRSLRGVPATANYRVQENPATAVAMTVSRRIPVYCEVAD